MLSNTLVSPGSQEPRREFKEQTIMLQPGASRGVALGAYRSSDPKPVFEIVVSPAEMADEVGAPEPERLDIIPGGARYALYRYFQNFGHKSCRVTIRRREGATRA